MAIHLSPIEQLASFVTDESRRRYNLFDLNLDRIPLTIYPGYPNPHIDHLILRCLSFNALPVTDQWNRSAVDALASALQDIVAGNSALTADELRELIIDSFGGIDYAVAWGF